MRRRRQPIVLGLAVVAVLAAAVAGPAPSGAQDPGDLRGRADSQRAREGALAADVARLGRLIARLDADLRIVQRRRAEVQAELDADRLELARIRAALDAQRRRVVRLRARLAQARTILSTRLAALYRMPPPDLITVLTRARGFADLLEQATNVEAIGEQDERIILAVRRARADASAAVRRLGRQEARQAEVTARVQRRRDALAAMDAALGARRAALARARATRAAALVATRAERARLERRIAALEAARARTAAVAGPGGPWTIPWAVVQCESGGQNLSPNSAGASGYYQFMPATWRGLGGSTPHAYLASKAEQDQLAARLWAGGAGASNWVCAGLVR
jgi:peptidoglycan hydrolase CwlO-like protein